VAIFPIDARGLMGDPPGGRQSSASSRGNGSTPGRSTTRSAPASTIPGDAGLAGIDTGGKAFLDSNDLSLGHRAGAAEFRSYYILGYYTTNPALDGKYRKIPVS